MCPMNGTCCLATGGSRDSFSGATSFLKTTITTTTTINIYSNCTARPFVDSNLGTVLSNAIVSCVEEKGKEVKKLDVRRGFFHPRCGHGS